MSGTGLVRLYSRHPDISEGFDKWLWEQEVALFFVTGGRVWTVGVTTAEEPVVSDAVLGSATTAIATGPGSSLPQPGNCGALSTVSTWGRLIRRGTTAFCSLSRR